VYLTDTAFFNHQVGLPTRWLKKAVAGPKRLRQ